jgi:hypothetical protein
MRAESIVFAIAGMCFGVILGWVIGTQQAVPRTVAAVASEAAPPPAQAAGGKPPGETAPGQLRRWMKHACRR